MQFRYLSSKGPGGVSIKRPSIPVLFYNGDVDMELTPLLDSGADMSAIDYRLAITLGLDLSGKRIVSYGISGAVESVVSNVSIKIGKGHEHYSFQIPIRILFPDSDYVAPTLLGRKGFFERFKITIEESSQKVKLTFFAQDAKESKNRRVESGR